MSVRRPKATKSQLLKTVMKQMNELVLNKLSPPGILVFIDLHLLLHYNPLGINLAYAR